MDKLDHSLQPRIIFYSNPRLEPRQDQKQVDGLKNSLQQTNPIKFAPYFPLKVPEKGRQKGKANFIYLHVQTYERITLYLNVIGLKSQVHPRMWELGTRESFPNPEILWFYAEDLNILIFVF